MNIIYLHGLASSGQSNTATMLRELLPYDNVVSPDIPVSPIAALQLLLKLSGNYSAEDTIVIGTSMGGMYAAQMKGYRRILINPAFHVSEILEKKIGENIQFFSERVSGEKFFTVTSELCYEFRKMESNLMELNDEYSYDEELYDPQQVIGMFGDSDNVCNCQDEFLSLFNYWTKFTGGHRLTKEVIEDVLYPIIEWMRKPDFKSSTVFVPFDEITRGDVGYIGFINDFNAYKIVKKGIGRKWFDEIVREYQGTKFHDGRDIDLHFPVMPDGMDIETVQLVFGNRFWQTPSVKIYGKDGVKVTDGDFYINETIHIRRNQ